MDAAKKGASALDAGRFAEAVEHYNIAIREHPESADYYIQRSTANRRNKNNEQALTDADNAVFYANKRARRELIAKGQLERAIGLYGAERFADARQCLLWSEEYNSKEKRIGIWKVKLEEKLKGLAEDDEKAKISVAKIPEVHLEKIEAAATPATTTTETSKPETMQAPSSQPVSQAVTAPEKIRHDWYQSTDTVTVTLLAKNVPKDRAQVVIEARALSISFPLPTGSDYDFSIDPLFGEVDVASSTYKIMSTKVEIILRKSTPGTKWGKLEADVKDVESTSEGAAAPVTEARAPSYPTSSRSGPKNWDKVVRDIRNADKPEDDRRNNDDDDDDDDAKDDPNYFFKRLYKDANPDVKRAMMKSYQESNGTTLSTNWDEVQKTTYECEPPEGMEAKKWGV